MTAPDSKSSGDRGSSTGASASDRPSSAGSAPPSSGSVQRKPVVSHLRHELRTALTAVIGYSDFLLESLDDDQGPQEMSRGLRDLKGAGDMTLAVVESHLDPTKLGDLPDGALPSVLSSLALACAPSVSVISGSFPGLIAAAEREGRYAIIPLLCKIQASGAMLDSLLQGYARGDVSPSLAAAAAIPAADAGAPQPQTAKPLIDELDEDPRKGRVLIVDDNSINRDLLRQWLERRGHEVEEASGGRSALELLRSRDYDVILLDLRMPDLDGAQVLTSLREEGRLGKTPVIMLSASDDVEGVVQCIKLGADDYLLKPYNAVLLRARLRLSLELKRLREREQEFAAYIERSRA
jgi:CheY-like chemotaxis protein